MIIRVSAFDLFILTFSMAMPANLSELLDVNRCMSVRESFELRETLEKPWVLFLENIGGKGCHTMAIQRGTNTQSYPEKS